MYGLVARGQTPEPTAIRNEVARDLGPADEVLVLRHHRLRKGGHEPFLQLSELGVWPWFARLGARVTGQWVVIDPDGGNLGYDDVYRLARYASFKHWRDTRGRRSSTLAGNGPARDRYTEALRLRREFQVSSDGGYFLQGRTATTRPVCLPGVTGEQYAPLAPGVSLDPADAVVAVRHDVPTRTSGELVALTYRKIRKGSFADILVSTTQAVWPFEEKLGARPIGIWKVIHPPAPSRTEDNPYHDEMIAMTRYASHAHYEALQPDTAASEGGNGPDWRAWQDGLGDHAGHTLETRVEFLHGALHATRPDFMPALPERYGLVGER